MKQLVQDLKSGETRLENVPVPTVGTGQLLVRATRSLISPGTERMLVEFGRAGWLAKARQQPDKVRQVLEKIRTDGLGPTLQSVRARLEEPMPLGYSNVGRVLQVGAGVTDFQPGDRVVSNGPHAEVVIVPKHLTARIPDSVSDEEAAFTVLGAIALQGIRLIRPTLGESIAVFGLGLIGLLGVQILRAHGARVIGFDFDPQRVDLARGFGARAEDLSRGIDPVAAAMAFTGNVGVDGVLVAAATDSHELMHQAAQMCRKRGRLVLTGVTGLNLRRSDFYEKELTFQVSCSYGPGRYDPAYEQEGHDYPIGFVRWTEQRNFQAVLELLREGRLGVGPLVSQRVPFEDAPRAYDAIADKSVIGVILTYSAAEADKGQDGWPRVVEHHGFRRPAEAAVCAVIGAGGFTRRTLLPALAKAGARLKWVASRKGLSAAAAARKFHIEKSTTETSRIFEDDEVNAVVIATRHDSHARLVVEALRAGKSVFVEKPLCLSAGELEQIIQAYQQAQVEPRPPILMVGYNRRFAPLVHSLRQLLAGRQAPLAMIFTCNAGPLAADHWIHDPAAGGGRIVGEACHFIDLLHFLADQSPIVRVAALRHGPDEPANLNDTVSVTLRMADGSLGQINYFANGSKRYPKERLEVFCDGRVLA
ncbi:MAG TPA: dehydrogenase, partial [Planctomycetaceae bacterium]|nr:dehydrogenase [Planctomycetaceae bacterium]